MIVEFTPVVAIGGTRRVFALSDNTINNIMVGYVSSIGDVKAFVKAGGVSQVDADSLGNVVGLVASEISFTYKANDFGISVDGLTTVTDAAASVPPASKLYLGVNETGNGSWLNGYIKDFRYYPTRFADAILESESA